MPRIQLYLPDSLFAAVKDLDLPASELLQRAVAEELDRREKFAAMDEYIAELEAEFGPPSAEDLAWIERIDKQLKANRNRAAGKRSRRQPA